MLKCQVTIEEQGQRRPGAMIFPCSAWPRFVRADRIRLRQVIINLRSNAVACGKANRNVAVAVALPSPNRVRIRVQRTANGAPARDVCRSFRPGAGAERGTGNWDLAW